MSAINKKPCDSPRFTDILRQTSPENFANQITLIDKRLFVKIKPEELMSCSWNTKNKNALTPNIVAFIRQFNNITFWIIKEILTRTNIKSRVEVISFFIKMAKSLYDLSNIHSLKAIISAMQSSSIYRLKKTWMQLNKKDTKKYNQLKLFVSEEKNSSHMRKFISQSKTCIPYMGIFLTDLIQIDTIHPSNGGLDIIRNKKMNQIIKPLVQIQYQSNAYDSQIQPIENVLEYINSLSYIHELQTFIEDEYYKISLNIEPPDSSGDVENKLSESSNDKQQNLTYTSFCLPIHRRNHKYNADENFSEKSNYESRNARSLIDDSYVEDLRETNKTRSLTIDKSLLSSFNKLNFEHTPNLRNQVFSGLLKRCTLIKKGTKNKIKIWHKFFTVVHDNKIKHYNKQIAFSINDTMNNEISSKSLLNKSPIKELEMNECQFEYQEFSRSFHVQYQKTSSFYEYKTDNYMIAALWFRFLTKIQNSRHDQLKTDNLIQFERSSRDHLPRPTSSISSPQSFVHTENTQKKSVLTSSSAVNSLSISNPSIINKPEVKIVPTSPPIILSYPSTEVLLSSTNKSIDSTTL